MSTPPLPGSPPPRPRSPRGRTLIAGGILLAVVFFGIGVGVSALTRSPGSVAGAAPVSTVSSSTPAGSSLASGTGETKSKSGAAGPEKLPHLAGSIVSSSGHSWTVKTRRGATVTVTITADTVFGTAKKPARAEDFPPGSAVIVQLAKGSSTTATTVAAVRVVKAAPKATTAASAATTTR